MKPQKKHGSQSVTPGALSEVAPVLEDMKIELTRERQKQVAHGFENLITKIDTKVNTVDLKNKVESARKERNLEKARKQFASIGVDIQLLLKEQQIDAFHDELNDLRAQVDPEYQAVRDLNVLKQMFEKIPKWMLLTGDSGEKFSTADIRETVERFYEYDPTTKSWKARSTLEIANAEMEKAEGIFGKGWAFMKGAFFGAFAREKLEMAESAVTMGFRTQERIALMEAEYEGVIANVGETIETTTAGAKAAREAWKNNPELALARREADRVLRSFEGRHHDNLDGFMRSAVNGRDTKKSLRGITDDAGNFMQEIRKNPALEQELIQRHKNGQQLGRKLGVELKRSGGVYAFSISVQAMREAIKARDPEVFIENIANSEVITETIPFVGSKRSIQRLMTKNGDPLWAKGLDVGVNVIGDAVMVIGMAGGAIAGFFGGGIGGFFGGAGVGAIPGAAAGTAGGAMGGAALGATVKSGLVGASKWLIKGVTKLGSKATWKGAGKAVLSAAGKQSVKRERVLNEFGQKVWRVTFKNPDGVEMMVEAASKKALKQQMKSYGFQKAGKSFAHKGVLRETLSNGVKFEAITAGFTSGIDKIMEHMNIEDKLVEVGTKHLKEQISPARMELFQTFTGRNVSFIN